MSSTVLFLGASPQQLAPIIYAKGAGYRVVTCDNRPENPGHALADSCHEVSTLDREGVLALARAEAASAVVCYASDVSAPTAAYVAEQLGFPGNPLAAVELLTSKSGFRAWQKVQGYFAPDHVGLHARDLQEPQSTQARLLARFVLPFVMKPIDASGAKGVSIVSSTLEVLPALELALEESRQGHAIAESFVERTGFQVCGEGFLVGGQIGFVAFSDEHFTDGIHVPVGETFPTSHDQDSVARATKLLQDMFQRLGMRHGAFNFDLFFTVSGEIFVVEIGPRNGGNRMPDVVKLAYGVDLIAATVESALGHPVDLQGHTPAYCATYSVHAKRDGRLKRVHYDPALEPHITDWQQYIVCGEPVKRFRMGSQMIGNLMLEFASAKEMLATMARMDELVRVEFVEHVETT